MVLKAADELRHTWDDDPLWRESWYYNFSDPDNEIGAWLYLWVVPNQPLKSGMLVSLYHGLPTDQDSNAKAWAAPGHVYRGPNDSWVYCYKQDITPLISEDVDDVNLCGLAMKRLEPEKRYKLGFQDGDNCKLDLDCQFMTRMWDFNDNVHSTPRWLAKNRYHRGWKADGEIAIGDRAYRIRTTGDSDHSWGTRDGGIFNENNLKTYAIQSPDGGLSVKAQMLGPPGRELPRGYIAHGEDMRAIRTIEERSRYSFQRGRDARYQPAGGGRQRPGGRGASGRDAWRRRRWRPERRLRGRGRAGDGSRTGAGAAGWRPAGGRTGSRPNSCTRAWSAKRCSERMGWIVRPSDPACALEAVAGGKGAALARLTALGARSLPAFVVVAADAYRRMRHGRPDADLLVELRTALSDLDLAGGVAVRSSAIGGDAADASFAGLYHTSLDVNGFETIVEAIQACWAPTAHSAGGRVPRRAQASDRDGEPMAVVIQQMQVHGDSVRGLFHRPSGQLCVSRKA